MLVSFGNFKLNEILELIQNKDPLGLNTDIESNSTVKSNKSEVPSKMPNAKKIQVQVEILDLRWSMMQSCTISNQWTISTILMIPIIRKTLKHFTYLAGK